MDDAVLAYVDDIDLSGTPRGLLSRAARRGLDAPSVVFDAAKQQAQVVGSGLFSFAQGVTPDTREAISDSALLAQLVANKKTSVEQEPLGWYREYLDVLTHVGWVIQQGSWSDYTADGTSADVHQTIIDVLKTTLGPSVAALAIVQSALDALAAMKAGSPWLTIFNHETQHASLARFQVGLVESGANDDVFVSLLGCLVQADRAITQVLFLKFGSEHATFKANAAKVSINRQALADVVPAIRGKIHAYQTDYMSSIQDL
jgi:hypothetical protein